MNQISYIVKGVLLVGLILIGIGVVNVIASIDSRNVNEISSIDPSLTRKVSDTEINFNLAGKQLFFQKCGSCHHLYKLGNSGPSLAGVINSDQWSNMTRLRAWIRNPAAFMKNDPYTASLREKYQVMMPGFPDLTDAEIDNIVDYIRQVAKLGY